MDSVQRFLDPYLIVNGQVPRGQVQGLMAGAASFASSVLHFCQELEEFWAYQVSICLREATVIQRVPIIGTFLALWVPIGSLFIFQGPYFQCFGSIHAKNVNSVCNCIYTAMS